MTDTDKDAGRTAGDGERRGFEELMAELERIVLELDGGEVELDAALALFEQGVARLRDAGRLLDHAQGKVEELIESSAGDLSVVGFDTGDGAEEVTEDS